jgi:GNAT superfamily N-acetyltransferase
VDIGIAGEGDLPQLARLLWLHAAPAEQERQSVDAFAVDLAGWCADHAGTHIAFVARTTEGELIGMAWLAFLPRVPRPGQLDRRCADVQSVFVQPEHRGRGIGSDLVRAAVGQARAQGAARITVHSGRRAVPVYERLGFRSSRLLLQNPAD